MATTADIPTILRSAGLSVVVESTWDTEPAGPFPISNPKIMEHHDASPPGPSQGALGWIMSSYSSKAPSAQLWLDTDGVWHCIGKGYASHAGKTDGSATNHDSIGIETDHTTGEAWPGKMLESLRRGVAAMLVAFGRTPESGLFMHKTSAIPYGRKQDPDGLDLAEERRVVGALMSGSTTLPTAPVPETPTPTEEDEMAALATIMEDLLAEQRKTNALLERIADTGDKELANLRDVRTYTGATREAFVKIGSGESVIKTRQVP